MQALSELTSDTTPLAVRQKFSRAKVMHDKAAVEHAVDQLAVRMTVDLQDLSPILISVLQGGLVFTGMLMRRLVFALEQGYVHVGRYGDATEGGELSWHAQEFAPLTGRHVVLVDDILDQGITLHRLCQALQEHAPASLRTAVLVDKQLNNPAVRKPLTPDYVALECADEFLVGCGMDYQGFGRNLPGIYALPEDA